VIDTRELFDGHADIRLVGTSAPIGEPLGAQELLMQRTQTKTLAKIARYFPDPDASADEWVVSVIEAG